MTTHSHDCSRTDTVASGGESDRCPNPQTVPSPYVFSDYAQWERRPTFQRRPVAHSCIAHSLKQLATAETRRPRTDAKQRTSYGRRQTKPPEQVSVKLLRFQLADKRRSLGSYQAYREFLQAENECLMRRIKEMEDQLHHNTKESLERYQKFKGALSKLKEKSSQALKDSKNELESARKETEANTIALDGESTNMDSQVHAKINELQVLINYKEKEYPVKVVKIEQLREKCEAIAEAHQREENELQKSLLDQRMMFQQTMETTRFELEALAIQDWLLKMKRSAVEKAIQNRIMEKEIKFHTLKARELVADIQHLKAGIRRIKEVDARCHQQLHCLPMVGKCNPDDDLQLNFPVVEKLPV